MPEALGARGGGAAGCVVRTAFGRVAAAEPDALALGAALGEGGSLSASRSMTRAGFAAGEAGSVLPWTGAAAAGEVSGAALRKKSSTATPVIAPSTPNVAMMRPRFGANGGTESCPMLRSTTAGVVVRAGLTGATAGIVAVVLPGGGYTLASSNSLVMIPAFLSMW